jgi:hypothetical protein
LKYFEVRLTRKSYISFWNSVGLSIGILLLRLVTFDEIEVVLEALISNLPGSGPSY